MVKTRTIFAVTAMFIVIISSQSCKFNKIKKSTDSQAKLTAALDYYEQAKYAKALILFEDIVLITRMTEQGEEVMHKFAYTYYKMEDYVLAGYYFRKYIETYPKGKYSEDCQFKSAECYYLDSPRPSLDQNASLIALQEFENFIAKYPDSPKIKEANVYIDALRHKMEQKSYNNARLYYDIGYYRAAVVALENSLVDYPDTKYKEDILYYIVKANFDFSENSIKSKQKERYGNTVDACEKLLSKFPETQYKKEISRIKKISEKNIQ